MKVRPLHDRIVVQRLEEGEQRIGGIIIPDTAKEKPQQGLVIAAGNGRTNDDGKRVPLDVRAGDRILFGRYAGQEIKLGGEEYLIVKEDEVLAVIERETPKRPLVQGKIQNRITKKITTKSNVTNKSKVASKSKVAKKSQATTKSKKKSKRTKSKKRNKAR